MNQGQTPESLAFAARILGALFYFAPDSESVAPLVQAFQDESWLDQWPLMTPQTPALAKEFSAHAEEPLPQAFQRLFVGPYALPAPPWGSVWLDRENVLFGDSTLALRQWMRENSVAFESQQNEPEDHFGTLLMLAAWLVENERYAECEQLLAWHVLPWADRFLTVFIDEAQHPFYCALGKLAQQMLAQWKSLLIVPVADKELYR